MSLRRSSRTGESVDLAVDRSVSPGKRAATDSLPVQRKAENGAAPPELALAPAPQPTDDPFGLHLDPNAKVAKLHYLVDVDVKELGLKDLKQGRVGHTWVSLEYNDPSKVPETIAPTHRGLLNDGGKYSDPMGFWPKKWQDDQGLWRGGYDTNPFKSYVPGEVRHPDRAHEGAEKAVQSWQLTQKELEAVLDYADSKASAEYSVYFYNCTTFGAEAVKAAGKTPPSSSTMGICFPNAAYDGILKNQDKGRGETWTKDLETDEERTVSAPDDKNKKSQ